MSEEIVIFVLSIGELHEMWKQYALDKAHRPLPRKSLDDGSSIEYSLRDKPTRRMDSIAEIYRRINKAVEMLFDWLHSHPRYALLFALALFVLLLIGLLKGWKWACDWRFYGKLWLFDNCKPSTRRRVMIELTCIAIGACIVIFFTWK